MPAGSVLPRRLAIASLCLLSLLLCSGLAWWQLGRYESPTGTLQNLGYVLQWPLFGLFPAFMVYRISKLRRQQTAEDAAERPDTRQEWGTPPAAEVPAPRPSRPVVHDEEDEELAAYNRYLAELHRRDQEQS